MSRRQYIWSKPVQRFVSAVVVLGALFAPVVWWLFSQSPEVAVLYWFACTLTAGVVYAWTGQSPMDRLFRKLPWWKE